MDESSIILMFQRTRSLFY